MTGGRPVAEKYLQPMAEVKNGRMSTAWRITPHKRASRHSFLGKITCNGFGVPCRLSGTNRDLLAKLNPAALKPLPTLRTLDSISR